MGDLPYPCGVEGVGDKEEGHHENHKGGDLKQKEMLT